MRVNSGFENRKKITMEKISLKDVGQIVKETEDGTVIKVTVSGVIDGIDWKVSGNFTFPNEAIENNMIDKKIVDANFSDFEKRSKNFAARLFE